MFIYRVYRILLILCFPKVLCPHCYKTFEYKLHAHTPKLSNQHAVFIGHDILIGGFYFSIGTKRVLENLITNSQLQSIAKSINIQSIDHFINHQNNDIHSSQIYVSSYIFTSISLLVCIKSSLLYKICIPNIIKLVNQCTYISIYTFLIINRKYVDFKRY